MSTVQEIKTLITASVTEAEQVALAIRGAADRLTEMLAQLRLTAAGTAHPALTDTLSRLEQAAGRLDEAHLLVRHAMDLANTYRATI